MQLRTESKKIEQIEFFDRQSEMNHPTSLPGNTFCFKHEDKKLEIYCYDCDVETCVSCFLENHNRHEGSDIAAIVEEKKVRIRQDLGMICKLSGVANTKLLLVDKHEEILSESARNAEHKLWRRCEELKLVIDNQRQVSMRRLKSEIGDRMKEIHKIKQELRSQIMSFDSYKNDVEKLLNETASSNVTEVADELLTSAAELKDSEIIFVDDRYFEATFIPCNEKISSIKERNLIGTIDVSLNSKSSEYYTLFV